LKPIADVSTGHPFRAQEFHLCAAWDGRRIRLARRPTARIALAGGNFSARFSANLRMQIASKDKGISRAKNRLARGRKFWAQTARDWPAASGLLRRARCKKNLWPHDRPKIREFPARKKARRPMAAARDRAALD